MSEFDKKFFKRSKFYATQRDGHYGSRPYSKNTLFKYDRDGEKSNECKDKPIQQPTILLKARNERSVSPKRKENDPPATSVSSHETLSAPPPVMSESVKLIEDGVFVQDIVQEYLQDSPDFLVVGVLGGQGVGKSTIMNLLAQNKQLHRDLFNYTATQPIKILTDSLAQLKVNNTDDAGDKVKPSFKPQSLEQIEVGSYGTSGVDLYVTSNRVFLLDCQPVISAAILDEIVQSDFKRSMAGEFLPIENCAEINSLQMATFVLSVCHVVLLVQDWFFDSNFVRFLQTAEMLKPSIPTAEEEFMEYFPHVLLVHNRASLEDFTPIRFNLIQQIYQDVFSKSKLRFNSGLGLGTGKIVHSLNPQTCGEPFNLFLLPEWDEHKDTKYLGHPPFENLVRELRAQIHSIARIPLLSAQLTEKNWLQFAARVWETIKKNTFFLEYSKLMP
ncbi:uncharacterized protein CBL_01055 [Carabus blaptoides fortunei]